MSIISSIGAKLACTSLLLCLASLFVVFPIAHELLEASGKPFVSPNQILEIVYKFYFLLIPLVLFSIAFGFWFHRSSKHTFWIVLFANVLYNFMKYFLFLFLIKWLLIFFNFDFRLTTTYLLIFIFAIFLFFDAYQKTKKINI